MSTTDSVFLIITGCAISLFFILAAAVAIYGLLIAKRLKKLVSKVEETLISVEAASDSLKHIGGQIGGPVALLKFVRNILKLIDRS